MSRHARVESCARVRSSWSMRCPRVASTLHLDLTLTRETTHDAWMEGRALRHGRRDARASRRSSEGYGAHPAHRAQTVNVQMIGDAKGNRFVPASITIHVGDVVTWTNVSGAHNVVFWPDSIPAGTQTVLQGKMGATMGPLTGPLFAAPNATYTVSFAGLKAGTTSTTALPHLALGMRAQVVVLP